jgi:hypothetical protein
MKLVTVSLVPIAAAVGRAPRRLLAAGVVALTAAGAFYLFGAFTFGPHTIEASRRLAGFLLAPPPYPRLAHVPLYLGFLLLAVGAPVFGLAGYAVWQARPRERAAWRAIWRDDRLPIVLALVLGGTQMVTLRIPSAHYAVILVPFVAMLAGRGGRRVGDRLARPRAAALLAAVTLYLAAHVGSVQYYFVRDTRETAGEWLRQHVPATETVSVSHYAFVPPEYATTRFLDQRYLVPHEDGYRRYLLRNNVHAKFTGRFPEPREIYHPDRRHGHYPRIPQLFRGELPYAPVKAVRLRFLTPELQLARYLEHAPVFLGDTLIFARQAP